MKAKTEIEIEYAHNQAEHKKALFTSDQMYREINRYAM